jgi:hypothetical protein
MISGEGEAALDSVKDETTEAIQVIGTRDRGDATGVMFVKLYSPWDAGRMMLKLADVKFRGHQVKAQFAEKDFPMEAMHQVKQGMRGQSRVMLPRDIQRAVNERQTHSRRDLFGDTVIDQFEDGERLVFNMKGERVIRTSKDQDGNFIETLLGLGVIPGSRLPVMFPGEFPSVTEELGFGNPRTVSVKAKGKGVTDWDSYEFDTPAMRESESNRHVQSAYGLCPRCGKSGHSCHGIRSEKCTMDRSVQCYKCGYTGHHYRACRYLGFSLERGLLCHESYVQRFEAQEGLDRQERQEKGGKK